MTIDQFNDQFPDDNAILQYFLDKKDLKYCPKCAAETTFYRVGDRTCFACKWCGHHVYPLVGTTLMHTRISLKKWMFAIYLFSVSKHGVSAAEIQRHIGVSYKTAFRMGHAIRKLMKQSDIKFTGIIEADEAYLGGEMIFIGEKRYWKNKASIVGIVERNGQAKALVVNGVSATTVIPYLKANIQDGSILYTDQAKIYNRAKQHYFHEAVNHSKHEYAREGVHTNTIEGFWSHLKRSLKGTYHGVSPKYLQNYIDESVFRHNYRHEPVFATLYNML